jgi:hypothetical protein
MEHNINLKNLERKAYLSYHQDGILDFFIGFNILLFGLWILADMVYLAGAFVAISTPIYAQMKKQITIPRLGYVKFAPSRTAKSQKTILLLVIAGFLAFIPGVFLFVTTDMGIQAPIQFLIDYGMIVIGVAGMVLITAVAYLTELRRLNAYAVLFLVLFMSGHFLSYPFAYYLIALGTAILVSGAYMLINFQRRYPLPLGDEMHVQG